MVERRQQSLAEYAAPIAASFFVMAFELARGAKDSMWLDESFSFAVAKRPLGSFLEFVWSQEANMGPYYLVLWGWIRLDDGDLWIRALSALFTVAALWGIWLLVRRWSGQVVAAVAVGVFVFTPYVLSWSMQARSYSMAMAFTAWSMVFADQMMKQKGRWPSVVFGAMVGLAVATQISTVFVFVGVVLAIWLLVPTWETTRKLALAGIAAMATFAPFAFAAISNPDHASWIPRLTPSVFWTELTSATSGPLWALLIGSGWVCLIVASFRDARFRPYLIALAGSVSGVLVLVMVSVWLKPMFINRYLIGCLPLAVIAAVGGWSALWPRRWPIVAGAVIGISALTLGVSFERTRPTLEDYRSAAAIVESSMQPGDAIVAIGGYQISGLVRYLPEGTPTETLVSSPTNPGSWTLRAKDGSEVQSDRVWIVYRDIRPSRELGDWIDRTYPVVVLDNKFEDIQLELRETRSGQ